MSGKPPDVMAGGGNRATTPRSRDTGPTILVPLGGPLCGRAALPVAQVLAELERATVRLVHVVAPALPSQELLHTLGLSDGDVRGVVINQIGGEPAEEIVRVAAEQRDMFIVMCAYAGRRVPVGALGRVARAVLCAAPCPVVLVPPTGGRQPARLRRILVPCDGAPSTAAVLSTARELAERAGADLVALHVAAAGAAPPAEPGSITAPRYMDQPQHEWPTWTQEVLQRLRCLCHLERAPQLRLAFAVGEPGAEIVRVARETHADLLVLGWHGRLEAARAATVKAVIRDAPCPLLLHRIGEGR